MTTGFVTRLGRVREEYGELTKKTAAGRQNIDAGKIQKVSKRREVSTHGETRGSSAGEHSFTKKL